MQKTFEKIIGELQNYINSGEATSETNQNFNGAGAFLKAITIVRQESEKYNNGWIPVSEKLPEESLNSVIGWDEYRERCCFVQYVNGSFVIGDDTDSVKITAWMPLPKPYHLPVCADTDFPYNSDNGCPAIECGWRL